MQSTVFRPKVLWILAISLLGAFPVHAHLGESLDSILARLGPPAKSYSLPAHPGVDEYRWLSNQGTLLHEVWVFENESILESLTHYHGIPEREVRTFLRQQAPGTKWQIRHQNTGRVEFMTDDRTAGAKIWLYNGEARKLFVSNPSAVRRALH